MKSKVIVILFSLIFIFEILTFYQIFCAQGDNCSLSTIVQTASIFESLGLGFAGLLGALGGYISYTDWREEKKRKERYKSELRLKYPRSKLGSFFKIIHKQSTPGWLFLWDKNENQKRWIQNPKALQDLGFSFADVDIVPMVDIEFNAIPEGDVIVPKKDF